MVKAVNKPLHGAEGIVAAHLCVFVGAWYLTALAGRFSRVAGRGLSEAAV